MQLFGAKTPDEFQRGQTPRDAIRPASHAELLKNVCCAQKRYLLETNLKDNESRPVQLHSQFQLMYARMVNIDLRTKQIWDRNIRSIQNNNQISLDDIQQGEAVVDFAHPTSLGGGVFTNGFAQEEKMFLQVAALSKLPHINNTLKHLNIRLDTIPLLLRTWQTHRFIGRGKNLYGNSQFGRRHRYPIDKAHITAQNVSQYFRQVYPPRLVNILAMAAPDMSSRRSASYSYKNYQEILNTAYRAFKLARDYGIHTIHTGPWGTGVFRNSANVMAVLQILAAQYAGVQLVYHTPHSNDQEAYQSAIRFLRSNKGLTYQQVLHNLTKKQRQNKFWRPRT